MDEALKPCPFCGSPPMPDYCSTTDGPAYSFHCHAKDCPAWPNVQGETEAEAIAAWNTRADAAPTPRADEVEAVARAIKCSVAYSSFWPNSDYEIMAQAAIAALDAARGKAEPVAWMYIRKPEEWPPANPVVGLNKWKYDDPARPYWIETPLYAHPPAPDAARGDPVARVVEWQPIETAPTDGTWVQLWGPDGYRGCGRCWRNIDFEDATHWQPIPTGPERGEPFNG